MKVAGIRVAVALTLSCCAVVATGAQGQTVGQIGGPKELPPATFKSDQYIDSRGCVFLRAGYGGQVTWVPRVGGDRKVMCGYPPTFGARVAQATPSPTPAPVLPPSPATKAAPMATIASTTAAPATSANATPNTAAMQAMAPSYAASPVVVPTPRATQITSTAVNDAAGGVTCPEGAPQLRRLALTNGGSVLVCAPADGSVAWLRAPSGTIPGTIGAGISADPAAPLGQPAARRVAKTAADVPSLGNMQGMRLGSGQIDAPPPGYRMAWDDDRLNPLRGVGSQAGQDGQDLVWTRRIPATATTKPPSLRPAAPKPRAVLLAEADLLPQAPAQVSMSSSGGVVAQPIATAQPSAQPATVQNASFDMGRHYIQVGAFAVPENASAAVGRLQQAGLPAVASAARAQGRALRLVMVGPYDSADAARAALGQVRGAGFGDAFIR